MSDISPICDEWGREENKQIIISWLGWRQGLIPSDSALCRVALEGGGSPNSQTWCHRHFSSLISGPWSSSNYAGAGKHIELIKGRGEMTSTSQGLSFPAPDRPGHLETSEFIKYAAILNSWSTCTCMVQHFNCYNFLWRFVSDSDDDKGHLRDWWWDASHRGFLTFLDLRLVNSEMGEM